MLPLTIANLKMMARNWHSTFWALALPLLLVVVFGLFNVDTTGSANMAIIDEANTARSQLLRQKLAEIEFLKLENAPARVNMAREKLAKGDLAYLVIIPKGFGDAETQIPPNPPLQKGGEGTWLQKGGGGISEPVRLIYNGGDRKRNQLVEGVVWNRVAETDLSDTLGAQPSPVVSEKVEVAEVSYLDMVLMGLVSLAIMNHSIIAIAVKISTYRSQSIFKRMLVTPLPIRKYFASEIAAHVVLALVQAAIIIAVGVFLFGARVHGNLLWIFVIVLLGNLVFLNIGFILSAWTNTPAAASAMGNFIALPMIFLAGTFFSTTTLPWVLPSVAQALPLTPMLSALRQVAIDNAALWETWPQLAALGGWVGATGLVAIKVFRFS